MANISMTYPKESTWADFSSRLCRSYGLPYGSKFVVEATTGRRVRDDKIYRRKSLKPSYHTYDDTTRVSEVVTRIGDMLAVTGSGRRPKIVAIGPDGHAIPGNTLVVNWRRREPAATPEQLELRTMRREEIEYLKPMAARALADIEEGIEDPEDKMPVAVILELIERYGPEAVRDGIAEARI
jgi:hypothetical protein